MYVEMHLFVQSNRMHTGYHNFMVAYKDDKIVKVQDFSGFHLYDQPYTVLTCLMQMFSALKREQVEVRVYGDNYIVQDALKSQYRHLIDGVQQYCAKHKVVFLNDAENAYHNRVALLAAQQSLYELEKADIRAKCDEWTIDRILNEAVVMQRIYHPMGLRVIDIREHPDNRFFIMCDGIATYGTRDKVLWVERLPEFDGFEE